MGIEPVWNEQQTVVSVRFPAKWTWDDVHEFLSALNPILVDHPDPVDVIVDMTASAEIPLNSLWQARRILEGTTHPIRYVVVAGGPTLLTMLKLFQITSPQQGNRVHHESTLDKAHDWLHQQTAIISEADEEPTVNDHQSP